MSRAIIGPAFFGYLADIANRFCELGRETVFYDERPSNSIRSKLFVRFAPRSIREIAMAQHVDALIERVIAAGTTEVLLVSPEVLTPDGVQRLRDAGITVSMYLWDSLSNKPRAAALLPQMAQVASFDPQDCAAKGFALIPLYSAAPRQEPAPAKTYDIFYCTTLHSSRPVLLTKIRAAVAQGGWSAKFFLFYHSRPLWLLRYAGQPRVWPLLTLISVKSFAQADIAAATQKARAVIDIHHSAQSGLTMRTFEALSLGTVLLTTNPHVTDQLPDVLHDRIVPLDLDNLETSLAQGISRAPAPLTPNVQYAMSVSRFLRQINDFLAGHAVRDAFADYDQPIL
ncbi:MAG: hypothetical protein CL583_17890 [Alteromonadaceae bacterium]|nr:hypothetical protein [Alteromonadaceae bacterium]|tara:strand:- start:2697 stop:3719 length:1023 start_codon:yes stop_codon:yes gene_type:complete